MAERIGFLAAEVEVERHHIHLQPAFDIAEVHASVTGTEHAVQSAHHVPFGFYIDYTSLSAGIVLGGWIADDLNLLYCIAVRTVEHGFELLSAQVGRFAVHIHLHAFAVDGYVSVLIDAHSGCTAKNVVAVGAGG